MWGQSQGQAAFRRSNAQQLAGFLLLHSPEMENRRGRQGGEGGGEKKGLIVQESGVGNFTSSSERSLEETQALRTASRPLGDLCAGNYA